MGQIYIKRDDQNRIVIIAVKVTDDILLAGSIPHLNKFAEEISDRYKVSKVIIDDTINSNGCTITQDERGNISIDMTEFLSKLNPIATDRNRRKERESLATFQLKLKQNHFDHHPGRFSGLDKPL